MSKVRVQLQIYGRVQGVFFRQSTMEMARGIGLTGRVRNCPDGTVAAIFEGESDRVRQAVGWCEQGPPAARVDRVEADWQDYRGEFDCFKIAY